MYKITEKGRRVLAQELTTTYPSIWVALLEELEDGTIKEVVLKKTDETALKEMDELGLVRKA